MTSDQPPVALVRRLVTSALVVVVALFAAAQGYRHFASMRRDSTRAEAGPLAPLVRVLRAEPTDYVERIRGFGRARPLRAATVVAEVEGIVRRVAPNLQAGNVIEATAGGDLPVLVEIDDRDLIDRLERARAEVLASEADLTRLGTEAGSLRERLAVTERELEASQRELDRIEPLVPGTITRSEFDAQQIQVTIRERAKLLVEDAIRQNVDAKRGAEARLVALRSAVALAERAKERARVAAPFAGRVQERLVELGERVKPGDPLFTIVDLSEVEVPVALPAGRYEEVRVGAEASLRRPEQDDVLWEGTVARVAPSIETERRIFFVYLLVEGTPGHNIVTPGSHLGATVAGRTYEGVVPVPRRAFLGERLFVAVPGDEPGRAIVTERTPTVARYLSGVGLVTDGLAAGDLVLLTNLESVAEGSPVRIPAAEPAR